MMRGEKSANRRANAEAAKEKRQSHNPTVTESGTTLTKEMSKPHSK